MENTNLHVVAHTETAVLEESETRMRWRAGAYSASQSEPHIRALGGGEELETALFLCLPDTSHSTEGIIHITLINTF